MGPYLPVVHFKEPSSLSLIFFLLEMPMELKMMKAGVPPTPPSRNQLPLTWSSVGLSGLDLILVVEMLTLGGGRHFYIPTQRDAYGDEYPANILQTVKIGGDQTDAGPVFINSKKGRIWMPWSWQSTRWSSFTLVEHFQNEHLCEQRCFQRDKA